MADFGTFRAFVTEQPSFPFVERADAQSTIFRLLPMSPLGCDISLTCNIKTVTAALPWNIRLEKVGAIKETA